MRKIRWYIFLLTVYIAALYRSKLFVSIYPNHYITNGSLISTRQSYLFDVRQLKHELADENPSAKRPNYKLQGRLHKDC